MNSASVLYFLFSATQLLSVNVVHITLPNRSIIIIHNILFAYLLCLSLGIKNKFPLVCIYSCRYLLITLKKGAKVSQLGPNNLAAF
jgi:hypothetical protein